MTKIRRPTKKHCNQLGLWVCW